VEESRTESLEPSGIRCRLCFGRRGPGFRDAEQNARVERQAVDTVTEYYRSLGWVVRSKEAEKNVGYDLLCSSGSLVHHVEVKGVGGPDCSFVVTANEREQANRDPVFRLIAVTDTLDAKRRRLWDFTGRNLLRKFHFAPISFMARLR
jgi:hypothetical protein